VAEHEYRILGPIEVWAHGAAIPLGGAKQRAVLAILLLNANRVVSTDRLIASGRTALGCRGERKVSV
jgi:DNA-binding SARP family transcriptional activator